ncbi:MAG: hypothetical protein LBP33_02565 [Candidatus Adiutrix sp.]|jgi:hypothetical protein|nr:hypothetical protein [Candidatus Adiutrix sp.]
MTKPADRLKWFEAALQEKHPGASLEDLSQSLRLDSDLFKQHISQGTEPGAMAGSVIKGLLGCSINEFVENGRSLCGDEEPGRPGSSAASEIAAWLDRARSVLEAGGEKAETLKGILKLMKP